MYSISHFSPALLETISRNAKAHKQHKKQISFQEFEGSIEDAWGETDDDTIKLGSSPSTQPTDTTISGGEIRSRIGSSEMTHEDLKTENVSQETDMENRQPIANFKAQGHKQLKPGINVKQAIVSRLSGKLGKEGLLCYLI